MPEENTTHLMDEREEQELITRAQSDLRQFTALYQRYVQPVYRYLYSRIGTQNEAEEATAQTFLGALEGFARYRNDGHFAAWLFTIAKRKSVDHYRRSGKITSLPETLPSAEEDLIQQAIRTDQHEALRAELAQLSDQERELLRLRYAADLGFGEMGRLLGRSEGAVKKQLYRLLDRLKNEMEGNHD